MLDFKCRFQRSWVAAGVSTAVGIGQSIFGGIRAHKAQKELERLNSPTYAPNAGLSQYYKTALDRYQTNPYNSQQYTMATQAARRSQAAGLSALNDRRGGVAGVSRLTAIADDASLKAGAAAEGQQNLRFGQLGQATQAKAADDKYAFQVNQLMPYQQKYNLLAGKAAGGNATMNAGLQNIFGGLQSGAQGSMLKSLYGSGGGLGSYYGGSSYGGGNGYGTGGPQTI